jgi:hypothetical protein
MPEIVKSKEKGMDKCRECELAIYCYSESSSWVFRTKQEMEEKQEAIRSCPVYCEVEQMRVGEGNEAG